MPCRIITSPISGKEVQSKTWNDIYSLVKDEQKADQLYDQLTSEPFLQWFGDWINDPDNASKVVNEHGEPLIVYHGTTLYMDLSDRIEKEYGSKVKSSTSGPKSGPDGGPGISYNLADGRQVKFTFEQDDTEQLKKVPFDTFSKKDHTYAGSNTMLGTGHYFTTDKNVAEKYGETYKGEKGGLVYPVFLDIKNPYVTDKGYNDEQVSGKPSQKIIEQGHDGVIAENKGEIWEINAFESNQIKSVFNTGTYSSENDSIYYQLESELSEQADAALDQRLIEFLKPLGFTVEMLETLKQRTGVDAIGAVDIINKIVAISKGKAKLDTLPEETAHIFVELLGNQHPIVKALMNSITRWEGYEAVRNEYNQQYNGNEVKIKKEAIGKLIAQYIVGHRNADPSILDYIKKAIQAVLRMFTGVHFVDAQTLAEEIAVDILSKNYEKIKRKMPEGARLTNYEDSLKKEALVKNVADRLRKAGFYLTGSLALRKQGTVYRPRTENIHDLDFKVPEKFKHTWRKIVEQEFGGKSLPTVYEFERKNEKIYGLDINGVTVDFFIQDKVEVPDLQNFSKWQDIFAAKLGIGTMAFGRDKDLTDFLTFQPNEKPVGFDNPEYVMFQLDDSQKQKQQAIASSLQEKRDKYGVKKEIIKGALDEDEVNRYVRTLNGKIGEPKKRVTDFVRDSKTPAQIAKLENAPDVKKKEWKQKAALGTAFHAQAESIIRHATDSEGYLKPLNEINRTEFEPVDGFPPVLANALYDYLVGDDTLPGVLFTSFPQGTLFKVEEIVYDERASRDVAGTIDLIGIDPEGNIHIWDWKTKFLDLEKYDDVPFYSQKDYRIQLDQYKNILSTYGIKREQVKVAQAQPIVFDGIVDNKGNVTLTGAQFPVTDVKQEGRKYLVPVPVEDQSSGNKDLDDFIHQLYRLYETIYKQPSDNWVGKREQLNQIVATIRELQIKQNFEPLTGEALTFLGTVDKTIQDVSALTTGKNSGFSSIDGGEEAFKKALNSLLMIMKNIDKYVNVHALFNQIYKDDKLTDEQLVTEAKLSDISAKALQHKVALKQAFEGMMDWFAKTKGVENILQAEKEIAGWIDSDVQSTSRLQTTAMNLFYKLESAAKSRRDVAIDTALKSFKEKLDALREYAKGKGVAASNIFTLLTGDKNRWKMVDKVKGQVYDELDEATDKNIDFLWINKNIDVQVFKAEMEQRLQNKLKQIDEETPENADEELLAQMKSRKDYYKKHWDTSTHKSFGWFDRETLKKYIKEELWYTDEYQKIKSEKPLLEMYQWIEEFNRAAFKAGYFDGEWSASLRSLPWVRGSFLDKIGKGGIKAFSDTLKDIYTIHQEEEHQYRQSKDAKQKNIPRPFTHNLGKQEDGSYDLSGVSTDIGQTMTLFIQSVLDYQHTKEIESYVEALVLLEESKGHLRGQKGTDKLAIDQYGNFITDEGNEQNTKILEEQVNALVYKQYYDEKTGLPAEATKAIETGNDYLRLKVFSLNVLTPIINTLGSSMQGMINSGKLFKGREWATNFMRFMTNKLSGNEGAVRKGLLDYFGLLHSNEKGQQVKQMSVEQLHRHSVKDILLGFMRLSDAIIQGTTGLSMLENSMITSDGRIVNIREYVRRSAEFRRIYDKNVSYSERKALEKSFEKRVQELKETQSLIKKAKFNDKGILEIEGLSKDSDAYHAFRNVVRNEIGRITGMMSEAEKRNMERNILWKSMLMFKGWVPRLAEVRFGQIKHNHATDQYEMGRTRLWFDILYRGTEQGKREGNILKGLIQGIKDLGDMRKANDRGLELLSQYYHKVAANYKARTGKELKMTPEEFYQMTREAIVMQYKDVAILLSLLSVFFYVKGTPPPDDPDDKNMRHIIVKALDKLKDEVSFYYNPLSAKQIFGGTLIPSLGVISDVFTTVGSTYTELFSDEDKQEKNHWIKRMMQNFPVSQQAASFFFPLADQELAKDLGIRVNEESRLNY